MIRAFYMAFYVLPSTRAKTEREKVSGSEPAWGCRRTGRSRGQKEEKLSLNHASKARGREKREVRLSPQGLFLQHTNLNKNDQCSSFDTCRTQGGTTPWKPVSGGTS